MLENGSILKGLSFGLTSGIITTLGLIVGLDAGTHDKKVVISGILVIALADAMSDALGMHISEESQKGQSTRHVWESTVATFAAKLIFALTFVVPILLLPLQKAIYASAAWGLFLIGLFSYFIAIQKKGKVWHVILEHVSITLFVIFATHSIGHWAGSL